MKYQYLVKKINWLVIKTQPDIKNIVFLFQYRINIFIKADQRAVTNILRYLKAIDYLEIELAADYIYRLKIYINTAYQNYKNRKSTENAIIIYTEISIL